MSEGNSYIIGTVFPIGLTVQHIRSQKCYPRFLEVLRLLAKSSHISGNNTTLLNKVDTCFAVSFIQYSGELWHYCEDDYNAHDKLAVAVTPYQFLKKYKQEIEYLELKEKHVQSLR